MWRGPIIAGNTVIVIKFYKLTEISRDAYLHFPNGLLIISYRHRISIARRGTRQKMMINLSTKRAAFCIAYFHSNELPVILRHFRETICIHGILSCFLLTSPNESLGHWRRCYYFFLHNDAYLPFITQFCNTTPVIIEVNYIHGTCMHEFEITMILTSYDHDDKK